MAGPLLHQQRVWLDLALSGVLASQRVRSPETVGEPSRCAERNGVGMPVGLGLDIGGAEVFAEIHHGVLRMQQEAAGGVPGLARTPLARHPLTFVTAVYRRGKRYTVVLVGLVDDSLAVSSQEVARYFEMLGRQVREAVRRHLVGDVENLLEVQEMSCEMSQSSRRLLL